MVPQLLSDRHFHFICDKVNFTSFVARGNLRMRISHCADTSAEQISRVKFAREIPVGNLNFPCEIHMCADTLIGRKSSVAPLQKRPLTRAVAWKY